MLVPPRDSFPFTRTPDASVCDFWPILLPPAVPVTPVLHHFYLSTSIPVRSSFINYVWIYFNTLATWCEQLTHLKRPWCWERLKVAEGDDRGWDGWMASLTRWTWVWVDSRSWWWTGRPGVLWIMGSQSQIWLSDWTELNWGLIW